MPHRGVALQSFSDTNASPPPGFDARLHPIIARHFFDIVPVANDADTLAALAADRWPASIFAVAST